MTTEEFGENGWQNMDALLKQLKGSSEATKRAISKLPKKAIQFVLNQFWDRLTAEEPEKD